MVYVFHTFSFTEWHRKKADDHAVCEHNLRKIVAQPRFHSCRMQMPEIGSGDDKELIFFAILFTLSILCDVIHDVIDKHI